MADFTRSFAGVPAFIGRKAGLPCMLAVVSMTAVLIAGCDGAGASVSVNGQVRLDGVPIPAEIQIEQLDADGNRVGRSATAYADDRGSFSAAIESADRNSSTLDCRIVVRVSEFSSNGMLAAFNENAAPTKAIGLRRVIRDNDSLNILLTR